MKYLSFLMILCFFLVGCSDKENSQKELSKEEKQKIILTYVNESTQKVSDYEVEAFNSLSSVSGDNYSDDKTLLAELVNNTMPAYEKAVKEAKSIKPEIKELDSPAKKMVTATETFYSALELEKEALEKSDEEIMQKSNQKMLEYQKLIKEYHAEMKQITKKYNVDYDPTND
ncbi:hypothetical protein [Metabacillus sp. FJAT-52054]|uniref:Lipoprotein n=1 Tax=Metabacillus sediminis TaxID=3117746 RepID=A0ABZ2NJ26_9BACI